ncbi:MAG: hypothetical protein WCG85_15335 [Polyangia bacterium]
MCKKRRRIRSQYIPFRRRRSPTGIEVEIAPQRIVAMTLADELAGAVGADETQRQDLVDAALSVGQWLADQGYPGRWDKVRPAAILRCLDFLPNDQRERFLFSLIGLLGHGALTGQIPHPPAKQSIYEISTLTGQETVRAFARTTAAQLQAPLLA